MNNLLSNIDKLLPFEAVFSVSEIVPVSADDINQLSNGEKREFELCKNRNRQQEFVSSRITLKKMATQFGAGREFEILKDELGQPFGKADLQKYYVSIAHTDEQVFCGLSSAQAVGVDLEPVDRPVPSRLEQRIRHPHEKVEVPAIRLWTIKEAYIKLRGQGLRMNMNNVRITRENEQTFTELNNDKSAKICSFRMKNNWLAIAYFDQ